MKDKINLKGLVTIKQGDEVIVDAVENKFVDGCLIHLRGSLIYENNDTDINNSNFDIYLGTDTTTSTTHDMASLVSPIGSGDGTSANNTSVETESEISTGIWEGKFEATWNSGTVSGTVGELALFAQSLDNSGAGSGNFSSSKKMRNRLSVADSEFSSFDIDTSQSLTVEWIIRMEFE